MQKKKTWRHCLLILSKHVVTLISTRALILKEKDKNENIIRRPVIPSSPQLFIGVLVWRTLSTHMEQHQFIYFMIWEMGTHKNLRNRSSQTWNVTLRSRLLMNNVCRDIEHISFHLTKMSRMAWRFLFNMKGTVYSDIKTLIFSGSAAPGSNHWVRVTSSNTFSNFIY